MEASLYEYATPLEREALATAFWDGPELAAAARGAALAMEAVDGSVCDAATQHVALMVLIAFERAGGFEPDKLAILQGVIAERTRRSYN